MRTASPKTLEQELAWHVLGIAVGINGAHVKG